MEHYMDSLNGLCILMCLAWVYLVTVVFSTKPYICGSSYFRKMMDFNKGEWCDILDGLYWRFINNLDFFVRTRDYL